MLLEKKKELGLQLVKLTSSKNGAQDFNVHKAFNAAIEAANKYKYTDWPLLLFLI